MNAVRRTSVTCLGAWLLALGASLAHPAPPGPPGLDLAGADRTVAPGDDFFAYANGTWLQTTEIPPDRGSYGVFGILFDRTSEQTAALIQEAATAAEGTEARKIGDFYAAFLDEAAIEGRGTLPLQPTLDRIAAIRDRAGLARFLGGTLRADVDAFNATDHYTDNVLGVWVAADLDDPTQMMPFLMQGGLDMPDRAYYVDDSEAMKEARAALVTHIAAVLQLVHVPDATVRAARVFNLESSLAQAHASRQESDDVHKANNHWSRADFDTRAPGLDWEAFFTAAGLGAPKTFVVWQPGAVTGLAALAAREPLETWKDYLTFHAVEHMAPVLPRAFVEERFAFHGKVLAGIPVLRERAKRAVDATSAALSAEVGKLYVARHFPPAEKARAEAMVKNIMAAFDRRIDALAWMAPRTRERAKAKLAAMRVSVGYPDRWRDSSALAIDRKDAFGNADRVERFDYAESLKRLGSPPDRTLWVMSPQTVNAVNLPALNAMNFPAAILQPPFFDPARPAVMDYGAIGAVIGHEISHGFDDQGAEFDAFGRLLNWWTDEDKAHFKASGDRLVRQYEAYRPFPDLAVNGRLTLSENLADVAGLAATYDAYRLSLGGQEAPAREGLTGDQQFFLSYGQTWRTKDRDASLRQRILGDGHAPGRYRVYTVRNLDAWYQAFDVKPGQALYLAPADRVRIW